jgi:hypothetical protein
MGALSVTVDEYGILLIQHLYKFCWHVAAGSSKSADPILLCETPLLKHLSDATGAFKN